MEEEESLTPELESVSRLSPVDYPKPDFTEIVQDLPEKSSVKPTFKNALQAKKRLQAFSSNRASSLPSSPKKLKVDEETPKRAQKKGICHEDKAKAVIEEIEEIKKTEMAMILMQRRLMDKSRSRSPDRGRFKKVEKRSRNYRRRSISPEKPKKKEKKPKKCPKTWREFGESQSNFDKREMNAPAGFNELVQQFGVPTSTPIVPFKMKNVESEETLVPFNFLRYTRCQPIIPYSVNFGVVKEHFPSKEYVMERIPSNIRVNIENLHTNSINFEMETFLSNTKRWYPKDWTKPETECKILEKSSGLSFLQSYTGHEETVEEESVIEKIKKIKSEDESKKKRTNESGKSKKEKKVKKEKRAKEKHRKKTAKKNKRKKDKVGEKRTKEQVEEELRQVEEKLAKKREEKNEEKSRKRKYSDDESEGKKLKQLKNDETHALRKKLEKAKKDEDDVKPNEDGTERKRKSRWSDEKPGIDEQNREKTPDTDEYHSHWESDEDITSTVTRQAVKLNRSWESDEELFGRSQNVKTLTSESYEHLEIPLNINMTNFTRRVVEEKPSFSVIDELKLLEKERRSLSEERKKLELEKQKIKKLQKEAKLGIIDESVKKDGGGIEVKEMTSDSLNNSLLSAVSSTESNFPIGALENEYEEFMKAVTSDTSSKKKSDDVESAASSWSTDSEEHKRKKKLKKKKKKRKKREGLLLGRDNIFNEFDIPVPSDLPELLPPPIILDLPEIRLPVKSKLPEIVPTPELVPSPVKSNLTELVPSPIKSTLSETSNVPESITCNLLDMIPLPLKNTLSSTPVKKELTDIPNNVVKIDLNDLQPSPIKTLPEMVPKPVPVPDKIVVPPKLLPIIDFEPPVLEPPKAMVSMVLPAKKQLDNSLLNFDDDTSDSTDLNQPKPLEEKPIIAEPQKPKAIESKLVEVKKSSLRKPSPVRKPIREKKRSRSRSRDRRRMSSPPRRRYPSPRRRRSPRPRFSSPRRRRRSPSQSPPRRGAPRKCTPSPKRKPSPLNSPLDGFKKSVADSTISDDMLPQLREEYSESPPVRLMGKKSPEISPRRLSLDDRINLALGLEAEVASPRQSYNDSYGQYSFHFPPPQKNEYIPPPHVPMVFNHPPPPIPKPVGPPPTKVVQVGNILQVVPNEEISTNIMEHQQEREQKILQVGNMLQIVPGIQAVLPPPPPPPPKPVVKPVLSPEPLPVETTTKQMIGERKAEREKRRLEREKRRKEKEVKRKEKDKRKQLKLKTKTENMIKRAIQLEAEALANELGDESESAETTVQWPPLPTLLSTPPNSRSILLQNGSKSRKSVQFADGVRPGEGTSPSGGEELSSPPPKPRKPPKEKRYKKIKVPKKSKKKKIRVKVVKRTVVDDVDEEDNLPPPPPPPGSPPPHIFPSRVKTHTVNNVHQFVGNILQSAGGFPFRPPIPVVMNRHQPPPGYLPTGFPGDIAHQPFQGVPNHH